MLLSETVQTGIEYDALIPGLVPLYEEREACVFSGYNFSEWRGLDSAERATCVAHFRLHHIIGLHQSDAVSAKLKQNARRQQAQQQGR